MEEAEWAREEDVNLCSRERGFCRFYILHVVFSFLLFLTCSARNIESNRSELMCFDFQILFELQLRVTNVSLNLWLSKLMYILSHGFKLLQLTWSREGPTIPEKYWSPTQKEKQRQQHRDMKRQNKWSIRLDEAKAGIWVDADAEMLKYPYDNNHISVNLKTQRGADTLDFVRRLPLWCLWYYELVVNSL